jgi:hypothetical protein
MAFFPLFLFLLLLCFPVGCCFVAPLEEKELLRRKWLLLLWGSVEAGLKRSCWIVGENLVVLGGSRRCLTVVRKVAVYFQTVEGESRERGYRSSLPLCFPPLTPFLSFKTFPLFQFSSPLSHFQKLFPLLSKTLPLVN